MSNSFSTDSYFIEAVSDQYPNRESLDRNISADVLIVGAGMSGLSTAYALSNKIDGRGITLIEADRIGLSLSSNCAGMLVDSVEDEYCNIDPETFKQTQSGVKRIVRTIAKEELSCDYMNIPSLYIASEEDQIGKIVEEYYARLEAGFDVELVSHREAREKYSIKAHMGMINREGHCLNPASLCQELARVLEDRGVKIYEETKMIDFDRKRKVARTDSAKVDYEKIILTNTSVSLEKNPMKRKALLIFTAAAVTEPLPQEQYDSIFSQEYMGWDSGTPAYVYFRPAGENRLLIGGLDKLVSRSSARNNFDWAKDLDRCGKEFHKILAQIFPQIEDIAFSNIWARTLPMGIDCNPLVGEIKNDHYVGLFSPGLPNAFRTGEMIAQLVVDEELESDAFSHKRKMTLMTQMRSLTKHQPVTSIVNKLFF